VNIKPRDRVLNKTVGACVSDAIYAKLVVLAIAQGVTISEYVRGVIVDAVADEDAKAVIHNGHGEHAGA
jgi:hypothetical protein